MESESCQLFDAESGALVHGLIAQYGWSNIVQAETYTKGVDRKSLCIKSCKTGNYKTLSRTYS